MTTNCLNFKKMKLLYGGQRINYESNSFPFLSKRRHRIFDKLNLSFAILIILLSSSLVSQAQVQDNFTFKNASQGKYRGYSLTPFTFSGDPVSGVGAASGYIAVGSKEDVGSGLNDSVNIMMYPDGFYSSSSSYNIGISGATDVRAISVNLIHDSLFAITLQVRGGGKNDRIVLLIMTAFSYLDPPSIANLQEIELPDYNLYPTSADFGPNYCVYMCGFATDTITGRFPREPLLTDSKYGFIMRYDLTMRYLTPGISFNFFDSPIPMNPPPPGTPWNGLYNDYDVVQHVRSKSGGNHLFITGSSNGQTNTSWNGTPWAVNTSCAFMFDIDTALTAYNQFVGSVLYSNGDVWTLPTILPNRLPTDPSGLSAVDAMLDASGNPGFWVVQNRLDTTQWHLTHISHLTMSTGGGAFGSYTTDTVSGTTYGGTNTLRDALYKNTIIYGGQRQEYPLSSSSSEIGIWGKYGTDPFLISLDPYYSITVPSGGPGTLPITVYGAATYMGQLMKHPSLSPDPATVLDYYPFWTNSDCSRFNLPNNGARFSVGSNANYFAQMGNYQLAGLPTERLVMGDQYGQGGGNCPGAFVDVTSTDLSMDFVNVVRQSPIAPVYLNPFTYQPYTDPYNATFYYYGLPTAVTAPVFDAGTEAISCQAIIGGGTGGPVLYRLTPNSNIPTEPTYKFFPNPAHDQVQITWAANGNKSSKVEIRISDFLGKEVYKLIDGNGNMQHISIDVSSYAAGLYFVAFTIDGKAGNIQKLVVLP